MVAKDQPPSGISELFQAKCILLFVRFFMEGKSTFPNPPKPIYFDFFFSWSIVVYWFVNMWTHVRYLTSNIILVVVVQVSQKSKLACFNKPSIPFVDNDAFLGNIDALKAAKVVKKYYHLLLWKAILWWVCSGYLHHEWNHNYSPLNLQHPLKIVFMW